MNENAAIVHVGDPLTPINSFFTPRRLKSFVSLSAALVSLVKILIPNPDVASSVVMKWKVGLCSAYSSPGHEMST
jgi:hypothetical protein